MDVQTSCIEFISSVHGEQRRRERDISKRDLQTALKYGKRKASHLGRWKITWENVVYIVDSTLTHEVTSYAVSLPLLEAPVDSRMIAQASEAKARIDKSLRICTSHTVLVVDQSGSMRAADIPGHSSRSRSVFFSLANDFVAPQLINCRTTMTDVISLIEMRDSGTLVIHQEPISWVLHNKLVHMAEKRKACSSHGNFLPSLDMANDVLRRSVSSNPCCVHALFFLTDGKESDSTISGFDRRPCILERVASICKAVPKESSFSFGLFGYSNHSADFSLLRKMSCRATKCGAAASFSTGLSLGTLRTSISTLMTSLNASRTALTSIRPPSNSLLGASSRQINTASPSSAIRTRKSKDACALGGNFKGCTELELDRSVLRHENSDNKPCDRDWDFFYFEGIQAEGGSGARKDKLVRAAQQRRDTWYDAPMRSKQAKGIAIQRKRFAEGAERIVYRLFEVNSSGDPVGEALVAKVSAFEEYDGDSQLRFQSIFEKTQRVAARLARKFNETIRKRGLHTYIPLVHFLSCSFYEMEHVGSDGSASLWAILAEKRLDHTRYVKWNDNRGGVNNRNLKVAEPLPEDNAGDGFEREEHAAAAREALGEEEEKRVIRFQLDNDVDNAGASEGPADAKEKRTVRFQSDVCADDGSEDEEMPIEPLQQGKNILDEDVPQAFSHWTWVHTQRDYLVCDIQGVLSHSFELTDPVIHSARGIRGQFGITDHGMRGMRKFLNSHQCNPLCKELGIFRK